MNKEILYTVREYLQYLSYKPILNDMTYRQFQNERQIINEYARYTNYYSYVQFKEKYLKEQEEREKDRRINHPYPNERIYDQLEALINQAKSQNQYLEQDLDTILKRTERLDPVFNSDNGIMTTESITNDDGTISHYFRKYYTKNHIQALYIEVKMNENNEVKNIEEIRAFGKNSAGPFRNARIIINDIDKENAHVINAEYSKGYYFSEEYQNGEWIPSSSKIVPKIKKDNIYIKKIKK